MLYILFLLVGILIGHIATEFFEFIDGIEGRHGCNQNCNQGRGCTCGQSQEAK